MPKQFLSAIDLARNEILNARVQNLASAPGSPVQGQIYYNTTDKSLYFYDGAGWIKVGQSEPKLLYMGNPGVVFAGASAVRRYEVPANTLTVITNFLVSATLGTYGNPDGSGAVVNLGVWNSVDGVNYLTFNRLMEMNQTLSIDTYLPLEVGQGVVAGYVVSNASEIFDGPINVAISGIEYRV